MAAKILHSLTDDNLDLQKQIGCMNGIFQLFDRQHILTGGRRVVSHAHKGLHQGISDYNGAIPVGEANEENLRSASTEKIAVKNVQEKQRISNASSRASFSSLSRSSSSSSLDCIRASQLESASFDRIILPETPSRDPAMSFQSSSAEFSRHNRDIRDLVKDSMYKVKTAEDPLTKNQDSPRLHSEMMNDLKESVRVVAQHQEAPRHNCEGRRLMRSFSYHSRDEYPSLISRDAPRFSCDGRESNRAPDSRDVSKTTLKLKDLPRLSLDGSKAGPNSRPVLHDSGENDVKSQNPKQSLRPPSVVAKLMGLETLPHSVSPVDTNSSVTKSYPDKESGTNKSWKEPNSPRWRNPDSSMKPLSRFPLEPAPWKHTEGRRSSQKPRPKTRDAAKAETAFPSVYSEIEKRLKDLEFTQSGKDLRALKQILEAMQSKKMLQTQKPDHEEKQSRSKHEARSVDRRKPHTDQEPLASTKRAGIVPRHIEPPIVIMKPAKDLNSKSSQRESGVTSSAKNDRTLKSTQITTRSQQLVKDGLGKSSGSISPRLLQKKLELEKRARPPTPPDASKFKRQLSKPLGEADSPGGRRRPKSSNTQESGEKQIEENENMVGLNASFPRTSPSRVASESMLTNSVEQIPAFNGEKLTEFGIVPVEHSSPVSVLDSRFHTEDSPSSVTYKVDISMNQNKLQSIENLVQKLRRLNSSHDEAGTDYIASLCANTDPDHRYISEILLASGLLLRDLGSTLTDFHFHPSGHPINPELFLVLEQTKTSSMLREEHTTLEKRRLVFDTVNEILGRKLVPTEPWLRGLKMTRTAVNAQKLLRELCSEIEALQGSSSSSSGEDDERWKSVVCKDVMYHESGCWTDFDGEVSGAVLDIERSIFKDLVNEIVIGEAAAAASGLKIKPVGRRRPFAK